MHTAESWLDELNATYFKLHKDYEELFWIVYMGDHTKDRKKDAALAKRDRWRSNKKNLETTKAHLRDASGETKDRLAIWVRFFEAYHIPENALRIKERIDTLESRINKARSMRKEGYIDPATKKFVAASSLRMRTMIATHPDESVRKACFEAREKMAEAHLADYIKLIGLRNQFANAIGYKDFYDAKVNREDGMTKRELFSLWEALYKKTKYALDDIKKLEKTMPGLRKPWNFGYMMAGDFTKEEDPYFQFDDALLRWGRSFRALGIDYKGGLLQLDLLDRKGKWNNGFCHWPDLVYFKNGKRQPGSTNFTCNVVAGQVGSGVAGYNTLFHEGGHAAHLLNVEEKDVAIAHEYMPMAASWAETQSMFLDTMFDSIEWKVRYANNKEGTSYPFELYERKLKRLSALRPTRLNSILFVSNFEREIYEAKKLTPELVKRIARRNYRKYYGMSVDSLAALNVPHIYGSESSASYHGYGLAELALSQWRAYFHKKYGYIVDNPEVGREMREVWKYGSRYTFKEMVVKATGKALSADPYLREVTASVTKTIKSAKARIAKIARKPIDIKPVKLGATIRMVSGKKLIADNKKSFENMASTYGAWVKAQAKG